jgi:hypothetical protein
MKKARDYAFLFLTVQELAAKVCSYEYKPTVLVADSAKAITKGFNKVFTLTKRIDCWSHVDRNIDKNMNIHVFSILFFFLSFSMYIF